MGSVTDKLSDIANDAVDFTKNIVHGRVSDAFDNAKDLAENAVPGGTIAGRFIENHPLEAAAVIATIVTAGAAAPVAGEVAGTAATADSLAAADAAGGLLPEFGTTAAYNAGIGLDAAAEGTVASKAAADAVANASPSVTDTVADASSAPGTAEATNAAFGDGAGSTVAKAASKVADEGTISNILNWAQKNQTLAAGMLTGAGMTVGGAAKGALDYATAENKAMLDRETLLEVAKQKPALYQQFVQASSAGGGGVTLPFGAATKKPITTSTGQPIFGQGGIIGSRLGG